MKNRTMDIFELICLDLRDQGRISQMDVVSMRGMIKETDHYQPKEKVPFEEQESQLSLPGLKKPEEEHEREK